MERHHQRGQNIRDQFAKHHPRWDFWKGHPHWARWRWNRPYRWATWAALTGWFGWGAGGGGYYYDYGSNVVYEDNYVYVDGDQVATAEQYAQQAYELADKGAQALQQPPQQQTGDEVEWMPLGVFALAHQQEGDPIRFLQLAVAKDGTISGTYFNSVTNSTRPVQGRVDTETQRAAWTVGENKNTVLETGVYNLTQDETPVLVHFGKERTQAWLMVRLEEPESEQTQG